MPLECFLNCGFSPEFRQVFLRITVFVARISSALDLCCSWSFPLPKPFSSSLELVLWHCLQHWIVLPAVPYAQPRSLEVLGVKERSIGVKKYCPMYCVFGFLPEPAIFIGTGDVYRNGRKQPNDVWYFASWFSSSPPPHGSYYYYYYYFFFRNLI